MLVTVYGVVLFAAALHATWNAIVKSGSDKILITAVITAAAALIAALILPFVPPPAAPSWGFIGASAVLQVVYYNLVAQTYRVAEMNLAYPLMRGTAPLLVAIISAVGLGEYLSTTAWVGIGTLCLGILLMARRRVSSHRAGVGLALLNALVIATYTLVDGAGVRVSGVPLAYTLWIFLLTGAVMTAWMLWRNAHAFVSFFRVQWLVGLVGGAGTLASYGLALWAMTLAPVAVIAALRETSIIFAALISVLVLKERMSRGRIAAVCVMAIGAMILRLA